MDDHQIVLAIQELLDGVTWTPDSLERIAELLRANGYRVRDSEDSEDRDVCRFCGKSIVFSDNVWVDATDGDVCGYESGERGTNVAHSPRRLTQPR